MPLAVAEGHKVTLGIRPEHLVLSDTGIAANVVVIEPTGSETHLVLRIGKSGEGGRELVVVSRDRLSFAPGQALTLAPLPGLVHLFDTETGIRIG